MVHWAYDTFAIANSTGKALVSQGFDTWYFVTADYAFGHGLEKGTGNVVTKSGGRVVGNTKHPVGTADFASLLLTAQASKAKVVALANAGGDTINSIKQAAEFGLTAGGQKLAALAGFINDVHGLGLKEAQGLTITEASYWDMNDETRKWAQRFYATMNAMPNMLQTGTYSSVLHYLKAVQAGTDRTEEVMQKMRELPVDDVFYKNGKIREDGRMVHDMYLFEVEKPAEPPLMPCGRCYYCTHYPENANKCLTPVYYGRYLGFDKPPHLWGGWAEYVYVDLDMLPGTKIYKLPDDMPLRLGALSEPLTSCIRAFNRDPRGVSNGGTRS